MNLNDVPEFRDKLAKFARLGEELTEAINTHRGHGIDLVSSLSAGRIREGARAAAHELES